MDINGFLKSWPELNQLCRHNGWIDSNSMQVQIIEQMGRAMVVRVEFDEILREGSGNRTNSFPCFGRIRIDLARNGEVRSAYIL